MRKEGKRILSQRFPLDFTKFQFNRISFSADLFHSFFLFVFRDLLQKKQEEEEKG